MSGPVAEANKKRQHACSKQPAVSRRHAGIIQNLRHWARKALFLQQTCFAQAACGIAGGGTRSYCVVEWGGLDFQCSTLKV